ncbi:hypothetical protein AQ490_13355 [Wenjunlia vitaminophila]|uniref:DUF5667 domain-containing protein n=1 Tax=Wenjunlia vitaminophila TaxID=76728 RepID=A0A0T6LY19_WENVI|nr:DUF5667 domain-containing protein [Wenjunlia vitaminophila]KRV50925.1 hypothetical protein AQ490_13355 [Wenjunlia vitaminophila]
MIANARTHRRANAFAQALDARGQRPDALGEEATPPRQSPALGAEGGAEGAAGPRTKRAAPDPAQERMLTLADALRAVPQPRLSPEVKRAQRAQLVAAMEAAFADDASGGRALLPETPAGLGRSRRRLRPRPARPGPRTHWGRRLAISGLALGIAAGGLGGAAVASSDALPGDTLYGLKRSMEDLRLTMADSEADRGEIYLDLASTRLEEARRLMERGESGELDDSQVKDVRRALSGMYDEAAQGHDLLNRAYRRDGSLRPIEKLAAFSDSQRGEWSELSPQLPEELAEVRDDVTSVLDAIERDVTPLRALLPDPSSDGEHTNDELTVPGAVIDPGSTSSGAPSPSSGAPSPGGEGSEEGSPSGSPSPSPPGATAEGSLISPDGLTGGTGDSPEPSQSTSEGTQEESPDSGGILPPLLPDLFPGLDLGGSQTEQ